jgi:hypothetical protein
VRRLVPWLLAAAFAAWSYWPRAGSIPGWGGDSLFNLWSFEVLWHNLGTGSSPWRAPLFGGSPLGIAFSENQIIPALLSWPVRAVTGNGALALGVVAMVLALLAVACTAGWLRSVGLRALAPWGGLLFAGCGWLQSQYAHFQNLCVFVLPLALWAWAAYARDPRPPRLAACALAFGWIAGWNLYFLVFADVCLLVLAARERRLLVVALAFAVQLPFLLPYLEIGRVLGGFGTNVSYGAGLRSLLGSALRPRLLMPSFEVSVEEAGYLGVVWLCAMALSLRRRESRPWLLAAALAFWAAMGRGHGLYDLLALLPPVSALRATGRAQVLVVLFSLPGVLGWLETLHSPRAGALLALALADLLPAHRPLQTPVDPRLWGPQSPLARELSRATDPLLVIPAADPRFMLYATRSWTPYYSGYSGRIPTGESLVDALLRDQRFEEAVDLTRVRRVLALTPRSAAELRKLSRLRLAGCFSNLDLPDACLFDVVALDLAPLRLDRDTRRKDSRPAGWPASDFIAARSGVLDAREVDRCRVRKTTRILGLPLRWNLPLPTPGRARYAAGETVLHLEARQMLFRAGWATAEFDLTCE